MYINIRIIEPCNYCANSKVADDDGDDDDYNDAHDDEDDEGVVAGYDKTSSSARF